MTPLAPPEIPDYELLECIGQGSYGEVWLARNVMGTLRAVKIVYRRAFQNERPFEREFAGIKRFEPVSQTHESQLKIFHVGRRPDYFYYVMELADNASSPSIAGDDATSFISPPSRSEIENQESQLEYTPRTLRSEIQRCGRLPAEATLEISIKLTEALAHLHRHGLVHRDIKPSNIIFVNGLPKLADIGLVAGSEATLTFVGTEGYLPPEGPGKPPADIYSLGKVLYEMSTGRDRNQFPELPTRWEAVEERDAFSEFNEVIIKACAARVEKRYATADQMYEDLLLLRAGKSLQRVRSLERRLVWLTKAGIAAILLSSLLVGGYFYQQQQTRQARRVTAQLQTQNGVRLLEEEDYAGSLLWFTAAFAEEERYLTADERAQHRLRIGSVLQQIPKLRRMVVPDLNGGRPLAVLDRVPQPLAQALPPMPARGKVADYGGSAEFSPDGAQILISGYGPAVLLCDAASGQILHRLEHHDNVQGAKFTTDGQRVTSWLGDKIAGNISAIQIWDAKTGKQLGPPWEQKNSWLATSHDGRHVLLCAGPEAQIWNVDTRLRISPALVHEGLVRAGDFSPDGERILTTSGKSRTNLVTQLWDAETGRKIGVPMRGARGAFSPDGTRILTWGDGEIQAWDVTNGDPIATIAVGKNTARGSFFLDQGRIVSTEWYTGVIQVYDLITGQPAGPAIRQHDRCFSTAVTSDGSRIASSCGRHIHVWDLHTGKAVIAPITVSDTCRLDFSKDGRQLLAAGGQHDPVIRVWDLSGLERSGPVMTHGNWVFRATFSRDGRRLVTASQDGTARVWDPASGQPIGPPLHPNHRTDYSLFVHYPLGRLYHPVTEQRVHSVPASAGPSRVFHPVLGDKPSEVTDPMRWISQTNRAVFFAAFSPDSRRVITTAYDGTARLWEVESGRELTPSLTHPGAIYHASFSADGRRIATASADWSAQVWEAETGRPVGPPLKHQGAVLWTEFSPDGRRVVTGSYDMTAQLWDASTGAKIGPALEHPNTDNGPVFTAKFSPRGEQIVTASYDGSAQVWDARTGKRLTPPLRHRGFVFYAEFSPDGTRIVTASDEAQVWEARTGTRVAPALRTGGIVNQATFSADGNRVVTASFDGTARVWDAATGYPLTPKLQHGDKVWHAEFSPDGKQVVTASSDGHAKLWSLTSADGPIRTFQTLAQTLSGRKIDHTRSLEPLPSSELFNDWTRLGSQ